MNLAPKVPPGLFAAFGLARGRADGVFRVPADREAIVRSFWAIPLCLPTVICRLLMSWSATVWPQDRIHLAGREVIVFVLGWLLFIEVTHRLAPMIGRTSQWGRFVVVWNWCNVIEGVLVVVGGIPGSLGAPAVIDQAFDLITIGWALWLEWFATRLALEVGPLTAVGLVLLDQMIGILLASVAVTLTS